MKEFTENTVKTIDELLEKMIHFSQEEKNQVTKAYEFAKQAHKNQNRKSGISYIEHCLTVAGYVLQIQLDSTSIVAALLHDTIEKAEVSLDKIDEKFGTDVAFIVAGMSDVREFSKKYDPNEQNAEFKHLIMSATEDIRVIVIRLCEKVEGILTTDSFDEKIEKDIALRVLNIYAPIAEYLNLGSIKKILEDRAFKILQPKEYEEIQRTTSQLFLELEHPLEEFETDVLAMLKEYNVTVENFNGRKKGLYSAYKKATRKNQDYAELKDFFAYRIIVDTVEQCYTVLGLIHSRFSFNQDEFDDYISVPKENGYQSIHTVIDFHDISIEIQIRTKAMHEYNEYGPASHIAYKMNDKDNKDFSWTKDIDVKEKKERDYKINVFQNSIFVFTPKGLVVRLPNNATPLDFAFRIHTDIGIRYRGALVNEKMVPMNHILETGDIIEIQMTKDPNVRRDWLKNCVSQETKRRIRRHLRKTSN